MVISTDNHLAENSSRTPQREEGGENFEILATFATSDADYTDANSTLNFSSEWWMSDRSAAATNKPMGPNRAGPPR